MKNLIFLSSLIFLITACSKKDENISIEKKYSQNSLELKYEKEILNKMQKVPFSQIKGFFDGAVVMAGSINTPANAPGKRQAKGVMPSFRIEKAMNTLPSGGCDIS